MKKLSILLVVLLVCITMPLMAQEEKAKKEKPAMPAPPQPLGEDWAWMVGEWEGWTESPMGKSKEWEKVSFGLDRQFLMVQATSEMNGMLYKGTGATTINPKTGELVGYWIDNFRGMYEGKGKGDANKFSMIWVGPMGKSTRITEKVSDDNYTITVKSTGPEGKEMEAKTVMTRKKSE